MTSKMQFLVRRNAALFAILGLAAAGLAGAFWVRGSGTLDTVLGWALAVVAAVHLFSLVGARLPLLVADEEGIRLRVGAGWAGVPWTQLRQVVVEEPDSVLRDGRIVLQPRDADLLADGPLLTRLHARWSTRWYGAPLSVPLSLGTTTSSDDILEDLAELAAGRTDVVALHGRHLASLAEVPARIGSLVSRLGHGQDHDVDADLPAPVAAIPLEPLVVEPAVPVETEEPAPPVTASREAVAPTRTEVTRATPASPGRLEVSETVPEPASDAVPGAVATEPVIVIDEPAAASTTLLVDGPVDGPVNGPVIGPVIREARERLRVSIDDLSERTRIRPHVLEGIERDDFEPCGGDFYARGHLTTLARSLGLDLAPLMRDYEELYAHGPINARRVFEAELATGLSGGMRATVGGPKWSLLVAAVLCLMLVWGVARLFSSPAPEVVAPDVSASSAGLAANHKAITSPRMRTTTMTVTASFADTHLRVLDRTGRVIWSGSLVQGEHRKVAGLAPFTVEADNAGAAEVKVMGVDKGTIGLAGSPGSKRFG